MRWRERLARRTLIGSVLLVVILGVPSIWLPVSLGTLPMKHIVIPPQSAFNQQIDHIVIVMMENHAFDNYFGVYCPHRNQHCSQKVDGIPSGTCVPKDPSNVTLGCVTPFPLGRQQWSLHQPLPHSQNSSLASYDNGSMDGFYLAERSGVAPFGHYTGDSAPILWDLAEEYGLGDQFFSSTMAYSLPNHWHLVAGQSPPEVQGAGFQLSQNNRLANRSTYFNQANNTSTIEDLLNATNVSWSWYDHLIATNYSNAIGSTNATGPTGSAELLWDPMAAKAESYNTSFIHHFVSNTNFYGDASSGNLPQLSYLIPPGPDSDHPPDNSGKAQSWLASIVDAVERSPDWNHTALFITYDEYGGFYDHVAPPVAPGTNLTLGFRVPLLVVSPFARENFVSHTPCYFECLLRLVEDRFNLTCLTALDCNAPSLLDYFDFNQSARAPIPFPTNIHNATYPMPLQNATTFNSWPTAPYIPPQEMVYFPEGEGPDIC
ncbi:MAG: hypothetical protein L3K08_06730 [Thermoplasmata archaeon]|nr:hypothetical protein [Thermoplasmata archaeon]